MSSDRKPSIHSSHGFAPSVSTYVALEASSAGCRNTRFHLAMAGSLLGLFVVLSQTHAQLPEPPSLRVGAAIVDVSPQKFPIAVNGGFTAQFASQVNSALKARAIVIESDKTQVAIVVVDSCMMPRQLLDEAKHMVTQVAGIAHDHIMIAATHTHSAPAAMSCLGTDADPDYQTFLRIKIVEAIQMAQSKLQAARVGWGEIDAANYMAIRRWILRSDRVENDPFGNPTVRANMHAGRDWDKAVGESGPEDPSLSLISFQTLEGKPLAVLANLSMHYFSGEAPVSADYFGLFCSGFEERLLVEQPSARAPVVMMSHGCSGDVWRVDYTKRTPATFESIQIQEYTAGLIELAAQAYQHIAYVERPVVAIAEERIPLKFRVPDLDRLEWARKIVDGLESRLPQTSEEVYAREQLALHDLQQTDVVVQVLRLGEFGIVTTPTETYALTGMKIKLQSPLANTMVLDLTNGGDGYIPPPEQHLLGGYNTWPARSAGLEIEAEPKVVETSLALLEQVSGKNRKQYRQSQGPAVQAVLQQKPMAYYRLDEFAGTVAHDHSNNQLHGEYTPGIAFFLEGPQPDRFNLGSEMNRSIHFAGGALQVENAQLPNSYAISMWIWNGMPDGAREISGWFYSRTDDSSQATAVEQLGVSGEGRLMLQVGDQAPRVGQTKIERWTWTNVRLTRTRDRIEVFIGDEQEPDVLADATTITQAIPHKFLFGGIPSGEMGWEGRLDEIAIIDLSK